MEDVKRELRVFYASSDIKALSAALIVCTLMVAVLMVVGEKMEGKMWEDRYSRNAELQEALTAKSAEIDENYKNALATIEERFAERDKKFDEFDHKLYKHYHKILSTHVYYRKRGGD